MTEDALSFIYLPGGGGGGEDGLTTLAAGLDCPVRFENVTYPGWQRYVQSDFSADIFIAELTSEISRRVPHGPIRLMGLSIGGHFAYAAALRLQQQGREVSFLCAVDSFMVASSKPSAGWQMRALSDAFALLKTGRLRDFATLLRSKAWRALLRLAGGRLSGLLRGSSGGGKLPAIFRGDPVAEQELSMRLMLRTVAPWLAELDRCPVPLHVPAAFLRTQASAAYDAAWRLRCPDVAIIEVPGKHLTLFEPENIGGLRDAFTAAIGQFAI